MPVTSAIGNSIVEMSPNSRPNIIIAYNSFSVEKMTLNMNGAPDVSSFLNSGIQLALRNGFINEPPNKGTLIVTTAATPFKPLDLNQVEFIKEVANELTNDYDDETEAPNAEKQSPVLSSDNSQLDDLCRVCNSRFKTSIQNTTTSPVITKPQAEFMSGSPQTGQSIFGPSIGRHTRSTDPCYLLADKVVKSTGNLDGLEVKCVKCQSDIIFRERDPKVHSIRKRSVSFKPSEMSAALADQGVGRCPADLGARHGGSRTQSCQHWLSMQWDPKAKTFCMLHESCGLGEILVNGTCAPSKDGTIQSTVCSDDNFRISSHVVITNPSVPDFEDPSVCEILSHKMRKCKTDHLEMRRVSVVGFNGKEHLVTAHHDFTMVENLASSMNYICTSCSATSCSNCKGDVYYVSNFDTDQTGVCTCQLKSKPKFGTVSLVMGGMSYPIEYYISTFTSVGIKQKTDTNLAPPLDECPSCSIICDGTNLHLTSFPDSSRLVKVCSTNLCRSSNYSNLISIPPHFLILQNTVLVTILTTSGSMLKRENIVCPIKNSCDLVNCHLCLNKLLNPNCYDAIDSGLVLVVLIIALMVVTLLYRLLSSALIILRLVHAIFKIVLTITKALITFSRSICGYSIRKTKTIYRKIEQVSENETIEVVSEKASELVVKERNRLPRLMSPGERRVLSEMVPLTKSKPSNYNLVIMVVFTMGLLGLASSCSQVSHLNLKDEECEIKDDKMICTPTTKIVLNLGGFGADACVLLSRGETVMGTLQIKISSIKSRCVASTLYWTYQHSSHLQTECLCNTLNKCSDNCEKSVNKVSDSLLNDLQIKHGTGAGYSGCLEVPSHYLGSCVLPMNTCCFFVAELPPTLPIRALKVETCNSYVWEVEVDLKTFFSDLSVESKHVLTAGEEVVKESVKLLLTQVSSPTIPSQSKCIATDTTTSLSYLVECNKDGELIAGKLGAIKCQSLAEIKTSPRNCSFARSLITITPGSSSLYSSFQGVDFDHALAGKALPLETSGFYVGKDDRGYYFRRSSSETFSLQLGIPSLTALVYSKQATCNLVFHNLRGCFSCMEGAVAKFHAICTSYPVVGLIKCASLPGSVPVVVNQQGNFSVKLSFNRSKVTEDCSFNLGKTSGKVQVTGLLIELIRTSNEFTYSTTIGQKNSTSFFETGMEGLRNIGKVLSAWWNSLWDTIWLGFLMLVALFISILLIRVVLTTRTETVKLDLKQV